MADPPAYPETDDDTSVGPDRGSTGTPRWVKVFGLIALVVVVLFVVVMLIGGGEHGPGRHAASGDAGGYTPPSGVTEHGDQQPRP